MKKVILSSFVVFTFLVYTYKVNFDDDENVEVVAPKILEQSQNSISNSPAPTEKTPTPKPKGKYKDGSYVGSVADAFYGNIQVKVVVSDGKITDVIFLQYPNDRNTSVEINNQAMPYLKQEAIQAQSEKVTGVTGATESSRAFIESLGDALNQAI